MQVWIDDRIAELASAFSMLSDRMEEPAEEGKGRSEPSALLAGILKCAGFRITHAVGTMPAVFVAEFGEDGPVAAFLVTCDAMPAGADPSMGRGHGGGHHLLAAGSALAAVVTADALKHRGLAGRIRFYYGGFGGERGPVATYMAREGLFDDLDFALAWHSGPFSAAFNADASADMQACLRFVGVASHAAASPHLGRSALDALELTNVGINFLRAHIPAEADIHYAMTDAGGDAPNVVQAHAMGQYCVRAPTIALARSLYDRIVEIARGAALMTGTELKVTFEWGCSEMVRNSVLEESLHRSLAACSLMPCDAADFSIAAGMATVFENDGTDAVVRSCASSGIGDVAHIVPTTRYLETCCAADAAVLAGPRMEQGKSSAAYKRMATAAKALAMTALDMIGSSSLLDAAKEELRRRTGSQPYVSPIPPESVSPFVFNDPWK